MNHIDLRDIPSNPDGNWERGRDDCGVSAAVTLIITGLSSRLCQEFPEDRIRLKAVPPDCRLKTDWRCRHLLGGRWPGTADRLVPEGLRRKQTPADPIPAAPAEEELDLTPSGRRL